MTVKSRSIVQVFVLSLLLAAISPFACAEASEVAEINAAIQQQGAEWTARENPVSVLPSEQRRLLVGTIKPSPTQVTAKKGAARISQSPLVGIPASFDWRNYNGSSYVTAVRDQGSCGSCWAFGTVAALESQVLISQGLNLDLSEQVLLSCDRSAGDCLGGYIESASNYIRSSGIPAESCMPYTASDTAQCSYQCAYPPTTYKINSWEYVNSSQPWAPSVAALKNALYLYGPLVVTMDVYQDFYSYGGGKYTYSWGTYEGGHAILLVGYDDTNQCFIVKNSWGGSWGESGYFRIAYTEVGGTSNFGAYSIAYHRTAMGSLTVTLSPSGAVSAGAQWQVDGGSWNASGASVSLTAGTHTVHFKSVTGYTTPADQSVTISNGVNTQLTGTYTPVGSLKVTIAPSGAVTAGAQWQVDGGSWNTSGTTVTLGAGTHTVHYKSVYAWTAPTDRSVTITAGATSQVTGTILPNTARSASQLHRLLL